MLTMSPSRTLASSPRPSAPATTPGSARRYYEYALDRPATYGLDEAWIHCLAASFGADRGNLRDLLSRLLTSRAFLQIRHLGSTPEGASSASSPFDHAITEAEGLRKALLDAGGVGDSAELLRFYADNLLVLSRERN